MLRILAILVLVLTTTTGFAVASPYSNPNTLIELTTQDGWEDRLFPTEMLVLGLSLIGIAYRIEKSWRTSWPDGDGRTLGSLALDHNQIPVAGSLLVGIIRPSNDG